MGGMLRYGIPNYRFPRTRLQEDIDAILSTGVEVKLNAKIGTEELEKLNNEYTEFLDQLMALINENHDVFKETQQRNINMQG
mgnify:CR=1 FL=1